MSQFSLFEIALIAIAAVIIALEQGLVDAPNLSARLPRLFRSTKWRYVPAALIGVAAVAFIWRMSQSPTQIAGLPAAPQKIITKAIRVPTPDPAQAIRIRNLEEKLRLALAVPHHGLSPSAKPSNLTPGDTALLDTLRCQKAIRDTSDKINDAIAMAKLYQRLLAERGQDQTDLADAYSGWLGGVQADIKPKGESRIINWTEFENAQPNDLMKPPTDLDVGRTAIWRQFEAKRSALQRIVDSLQNVRCD